MLPDRLAEALPFPRVSQRVIERCLRHAHSPGRYLNPADLQSLHHLGESAARLKPEQRDTTRPGPCSTSRMLIPRCRGTAVGSVLHSSAISWDLRALVIQVFAPLIR